MTQNVYGLSTNHDDDDNDAFGWAGLPEYPTHTGRDDDDAFGWAGQSEYPSHRNDDYDEHD